MDQETRMKKEIAYGWISGINPQDLSRVYNINVNYVVETSRSYFESHRNDPFDEFLLSNKGNKYRNALYFWLIDKTSDLPDIYKQDEETSSKVKHLVDQYIFTPLTNKLIKDTYLEEIFSSTTDPLDKLLKSIGGLRLILEEDVKSIMKEVAREIYLSSIPVELDTIYKNSKNKIFETLQRGWRMCKYPEIKELYSTIRKEKENKMAKQIKEILMEDKEKLIELLKSKYNTQ